MKHRANSSDKPDAFSQNCEVYSLGDEAFRAGKFSEAKKYFKIAIEFCPEDCDSWWALGNCYDELKKPQRAESCFKKALEYADEDSKPDICFNLGNSLYDQEKYNAALEYYRQVPAGTPLWRQTARNIDLAESMLNPEKAGT